MTWKLKFYLVLLAALTMLLYLTPYFSPLLNDLTEPITEPFKSIAAGIGLNPNAFITATALTVTFLIVLALIILAGTEVKKQTLDFSHKTLKRVMEKETETQIPQEKER